MRRTLACLLAMLFLPLCVWGAAEADWTFGEFDDFEFYEDIDEDSDAFDAEPREDEEDEEYLFDGDSAEDAEVDEEDTEDTKDCGRRSVNCVVDTALRALPDEDAEELAFLTAGTPVIFCHGAKNGFCLVDYDGVEGYVLRDALGGNGKAAPAENGAYLGDDPGHARLANSDVEVYASSEQIDQYGFYSAANANDSNPSTTWSEAASGVGAGEWLSFFFEEHEIAGFAIRAGYQKSADSYRENARPREIRICAMGSDAMTVTLADTRGEQIVLFDRPLMTDYLSLEIVDAYAGTRYSDTCITDVRILLAESE